MNRYTTSMQTNRQAILAALGAACLFGASTPLAKWLSNDLPALLLAGLLYLGSGMGLLFVRTIRDRGWRLPLISKMEWLWLGGAIACGGALGPALLMTGLAQTTAGTASLLLNFEAVLTAVLAWLVFRENADWRIVLGMLLIIAGGIMLSWPTDARPAQAGLGPIFIVAACLCWAIDNNLTRKVSTADALFIAGSKGLIAGIVNTFLALGLGASLPSLKIAAPALLVGFLGYGVSLVMFVLALRGLGAARTGAYFSTAPFIGAVIAIIFFQEPTSTLFWLAMLLMGGGVSLHLFERHTHKHSHEPLLHAHRHIHDEHHQHEHDFEWDGTEPHDHLHRHAPLTHSHPHFPDIHHQHPH